MDKLIEALTMLRDTIDGVGRATTETADNPKWRYHRDTPHMKKMAGIYAEWAAAVQVIIDNLPAISHAAGQEVVDPADHRHAASIDAVVYGAGYIVDGNHVAPNRIEIVRADLAPAVARNEGEVFKLLREYKREYDNPAPDYTYRHLLRSRLFAALASSDSAAHTPAREHPPGSTSDSSAIGADGNVWAVGDGLAGDVMLFLSELPNDLGRGSLNGMRAQLLHKLQAAMGGAARD